MALCTTIYKALWHLQYRATSCFVVFISWFFILEVISEGCSESSGRQLYRHPPPHSGTIFTFMLHEMECLISASLKHPVMCLCGFSDCSVTFRDSKGNFSPSRKMSCTVSPRTNVIRHHKVTFLFVIGNYLLSLSPNTWFKSAQSPQWSW